jgi:hypothetical protein
MSAWRQNCSVAYDGQTKPGKVIVDAGAESFEVVVRGVPLAVTKDMHPCFTDSALTFQTTGTNGTVTQFKVTFPPGKPVKDKDGRTKVRDWGRVAEYYYDQVEACRTWIPIMREEFAQYPRLLDVYEKLQVSVRLMRADGRARVERERGTARHADTAHIFNWTVDPERPRVPVTRFVFHSHHPQALLTLEQFWHPAVRRRRKEIYCWEQIVCVESEERGLPTKMLRANYEYCKDERQGSDGDGRPASSAGGGDGSDEDDDNSDAEGGGGGGSGAGGGGSGAGGDDDPQGLGQFGRRPKFRITITHERMTQLLALYPDQHALLKQLREQRLQDNRKRPKSDRQSTQRVTELAELEFWARYFIRVHAGLRKFPNERFRELRTTPERCYHERDRCLAQVLMAAKHVKREGAVVNPDFDYMDDEEEEKERRCVRVWGMRVTRPVVWRLVRQGVRSL